MGYKLFFRATDGEISLNMFQNYFSKYPHFTVTGPEASYKNENTGARFVFQYLHTNGEGKINVRPEGTYRIALNVEYCVPSFFVTEALLEVEALINETQVVFYDPQQEGSGTKTFDGDRVFDCWLFHNEKAIRHLASQAKWQENDKILVSYDWMQKIWNWNYSIPVIQHHLGQGIQVPTMILLYDGKFAKSGFVWEGGQSVVIPNVDIVMIARNDGDKTDLCAVEYEAIEVFVQKYQTHKEGSTCVISYDTVPEDITRFIANLEPNQTYSKLSMNDIFEEEIVEDALFPNGRS